MLVLYHLASMFTITDHDVKRYLSVRPSVCPSVCHLSVTRRYSVKTAKHIIIFSSSRSHTILLFHTKHYDNMPTGPPPLTGASNICGLKKSRFSTNISLYFGCDTGYALVSVEWYHF